MNSSLKDDNAVIGVMFYKMPFANLINPHNSPVKYAVVILDLKPRMSDIKFHHLSLMLVHGVDYRHILISLLSFDRIPKTGTN